MATRLELYSNRDSDDKKKEKDVQFEHGYRLGFTDVNKVECMLGGQELHSSPGAGAVEKGKQLSSRLAPQNRWGYAFVRLLKTNRPKMPGHFHIEMNKSLQTPWL